MNKLINVINENLRSIISGIKINASDIENNLNETISKMDELVVVASGYKDEVQESRNNIEKLESEITDLENNLDELQTKFSGNDFAELLAAGNKEISNKIIEKRALISKESDMILDLTDKAHKLKEDLLQLKEQKATLETDLVNANVVKKYYDQKLGEVIDFADEHSIDLDKYIEEKPSDKLITDEEIDNEVIGSNVDGRVFEEIDELSDIKPSKDMIEKIMNFDEKDIEPKKESIDLSMTQQLDDIILAANKVLKETEDIQDRHSKVLDNAVINENSSVAFKPVEENIIKENDKLPIKEEEKLDDTTSLDDVLGLNLDEIVKDANDMEDESSDGLSENDFSVESLFIDDKEEDFGIVNEVHEIDPNDFNKTTSESNDFVSVLNKYGLEQNKFKDIELIENTFNASIFEKIVDVLGKHHLNTEVVYDNYLSLSKIIPENLDKILQMLEDSKATPEDIKMVIDLLDKVDMTVLEKESYSNLEDTNLSNILLNAINMKSNDEIVKQMNLDAIEMGVLKSNTNNREYDRLCLFAPIVKKNYDTLASYNIENARECFIKHPQRFLINNSTFASILDKYDPEDLVRCINKNIAVIDRL